MENREILPFVPDEERKIHDQLLEISKQILHLKKAATFTLDSAREYQDQRKFPLLLDKLKLTGLVDELLQELLVVRREFKRLKTISKEYLNEATKSPSAESLQALATVLTPTDLQAAHVQKLLQHLSEPLLKHVSPLLYPIYARLCSLLEQLEAFKESGAYSVDEDVTPIQTALHEIENSHFIQGKWQGSKSANSTSFPVHESIPDGQAILSAKLHACYRHAHLLISQIESLAPSLIPIHERLVKIWKTLNHSLNKGNLVSFSNEEITHIQQELRSIDSLRHGHGDLGAGPGSFMELNSSIPTGQAIVIDLLESCFELSHSLLSLKDPVVGPLREVYEKLIHLRQEMENIYGSRHFWSLGGSNSPVDQYRRIIEIQEKLKEIDSLRKDGKFLISKSSLSSNTHPNSLATNTDSEESVPEGQAVLHYLLHKCYRLVYKILMHIRLLAPSNPVPQSVSMLADEFKGEVINAHKNLVTLRRCLLELKKHSPWSDQDLKPWKMKLARAEKEMKRVSESKILVALWNECNDMILEMEMQIVEDFGDDDGEENEEDDEDDGQQVEQQFRSYRPFPVATNFDNLPQ